MNRNVAPKLESLRLAVSSPVLFTEIGLRLAFVETALQTTNFKAAAELLSKSRLHRPGLRTETLRLAQRFSGSLERRLFKRPSCLTTSFVLFWMSEPGTTLKIGVKKDSPSFEAHAWVERQGEIFSTTSDLSQFEELLVIQRGRR